MEDQYDLGIASTRRGRMLGPDARCRLCGFADVAALQRDAEGIICYECASAAAGRSTTEDHHPLGRANDPDTTIGAPGNLHRLLDAQKAIWPEAVRKNTNRDPLLMIVAVTLAVRDFARVMMLYAQSIADWLIQLHRTLRDRDGDAWWLAFNLPPLWGTA